MRITYLHQYFNTLDMTGGTRSFEFARRLVAMGHTVNLVTTDRSDGRSGGGWRVTNEDGIVVHWTPVAYSNSMSYGNRIRAFTSFAVRCGLRASRISTDVVFASSTPLTVALPGVFAARRQGAPMVLEVRDLWPEVPMALGALRDPISRIAAVQLESYAYSNAERIVALSPGMRDGVIAAGYPPEKVVVVPNASDSALFSGTEESSASFRQGDAWIGGRPLVVYCGTVGLVNGVDYLVRVAAEMRNLDPEVRFLIVGSGRCLGKVTELAAALGVAGVNLKISPEVPKSEMPTILGAATVAVSTVADVPALWANSANKVFDAFAAGVPLAINHDGWLADLLRESGAGIVMPPTDALSGAAMLRSMIRDTEGLHAMGERSHRLGETRFDRDRLARDLERVLKAAVASRSHTGHDS